MSLASAELTQQGFPYDRRFMLLKVHREDPSVRYDNMHVAYFPKMCLFTTSIVFPSQAEKTSGSVEVTYTNPEDESLRKLSVPLQPDFEQMKTIDVNMHQSQTQGYAMGEEYSKWFSSCFGFEVVLAYVGNNGRPVLGNIAPNAAARNAQLKLNEERKTTSWLPSIASSIGTTLGVLNTPDPTDEGYEIGFADCAPYLVASTKSLENVSERLPEGEVMDITKFRPNIILSGAEDAFEEDYWAELRLGSDAVKLHVTSNCVRCPSINVDYTTGAPGTGASGSVLKKLQSDRRIDEGVRYSPVFGRYAFLDRALDSLSKGELVISVGDEVRVTKRNAEHTVVKWPGMGSTAKTDLYPV